MAQPLLTFGVEIEFLVGHLSPDDPSPAGADRHTVRFPTNNEAIHFVETKYEDDEDDEDVDVEQIASEKDRAVQAISIREHIAQTLSAQGAQAYSTLTNSATNFALWNVTGDASLDVSGEDSEGYRWVDVQAVSPKLEFTPENLARVKNVCDKLARTYKYRVNTTTGMHVHVGDGNRGFSFPIVKKLVSFFWAFEPQLNTLHPNKRIDSGHTASMRNHSTMAIDHHLSNGYKLSAIHGLALISNCKDLSELVSETACNALARNGNYNLQHESTLNSTRVTSWIKTVVGIVDAIRKLPDAEFEALIRIYTLEKWQKHGEIGVENDGDGEMRDGPILAESSFRADDLLRAIGLDECAAFYAGRGLYHHEYRRAKPLKNASYYQSEERFGVGEHPDFLVTWDFETDEVNFPPNSAARQEAKAKKALWQRTVMANKLNKALDPNFVELDTTSDFWPAHTVWNREFTSYSESVEVGEGGSPHGSNNSSNDSAGSGSAPRFRIGRSGSPSAQPPAPGCGEEASLSPTGSDYDDEYQ